MQKLLSHCKFKDRAIFPCQLVEYISANTNVSFISSHLSWDEPWSFQLSPKLVTLWPNEFYIKQHVNCSVNIGLYIYIYTHKRDFLLNILNTKTFLFFKIFVYTVLQIWLLGAKHNKCFFMTENICKKHIFHNHFPVNYSA